MSYLPPSLTGRDRLLALGLFAILLALALTPLGYGQSPDEHAKHHPKGDNPAMPATGKDAGMGGAGNDAANGGGMKGGMDGMMEKMGGPPQTELYPSLMSVPELTPEQREQVGSQADDRMRSGVALLSEGLDQLATATDSEDYAGMQIATSVMREAVARFESGLAARRALAEGKPPRHVALQWFKGEMSLQPPQGVKARSDRPGVSLFHLFTMILLVAFALAMVAMYFAKMRRATALFRRIEADKTWPPPGSAPPLVDSPGPTTPTTPADEKTRPPGADDTAALPAAEGS